MEANSTNSDFIDALLQEVEADKENKIFGENTEKAVELMNKMLEVQKSRLIMGETFVEKKKEAKPQKAQKQKQAKRELTEEESAEYDKAIKSAKSKFDHEDTYFAKGMKGVNEYAGLIAKECLSDITPKDEKEHQDLVVGLIKQDFIAFNKAKKGK